MNRRMMILIGLFAVIGVGASAVLVSNQALAQVTAKSAQKGELHEGQHGQEGEEHENDRLTATVGITQAVEAATGRVAGYVNQAELGDDDGKLIWEIAIVKTDGTLWDVEVDATTGAIIKAAQDQDDQHEGDDDDGDGEHEDGD